MGEFTKWRIPSVFTPGQLWGERTITHQLWIDSGGRLLRLLKVEICCYLRRSAGIRSFEEKTRGNLQSVLPGKEHCVDFYLVCGSSQASLWRDETTTWKQYRTKVSNQSKWKTKKVLAVTRSIRGTVALQQNLAHQCWVCAMLCVSLQAGWTPTQWGTRNQVTSMHQQSCKMLIAAEQ